MDSNQAYSAAEVEQMMKLQDVLLKSLLQPTSLQLRSTDQVRPDTNSAW